MAIIRWPSQAPSFEERIGFAWDHMLHGEILELFLYALKVGVPGPDISDHPDNDSEDDLYSGECYCLECLGYD